MPDQIGAELLPQDRFLLCSAGICASLSDIEINEMLSASDTPDEAAQSLTQNAMIGGRTDSLSAAAIFISGPAEAG